MRVIPVGYGNSKHRDFITEQMTNLDMALVSVCYSPYAGLYAWSVANLKKRYDERFRWMQKLGNVNYKNGLPIEIADLDGGLTELIELLWSGKTVLLLCGCGTMEPTKQHPYGCHRKVVCDALVEACSEVEVALPETIFAREQMVSQALEDREALYMQLNSIQPATADYWLLPLAQQGIIRQQIGKF